MKKAIQIIYATSFLIFLIGLYYLCIYIFPSDKSTAWSYLIICVPALLIHFATTLIFLFLSILSTAKKKLKENLSVWIIYLNIGSLIFYLAIIVVMFFKQIY